MSNLAPSARDFIGDNKERPLLAAQLITDGVVNLTPSNFEWSGSSVYGMLSVLTTAYQRLETKDNQLPWSGSERLYPPLAGFRISELERIGGGANSVSNELHNRMGWLNLSVQRLQTANATKDVAKVQAAYFDTVWHMNRYMMTLVEWFMEAMVYQPDGDYESLSFTASLLRTGANLDPVNSRYVRNAGLLYLMLGAYLQVVRLTQNPIGQAVDIYFQAPLAQLMIRHAHLVPVPDGTRVQALKYNRFVDTLMGCWNVGKLRDTLHRLKVELGILGIDPATNDCAILITRKIIQAVEARILQLLPDGEDHGVFHGHVDTSAFANGRHMSFAVDHYYDLKSEDFRKWLEVDRERNRQYYHDRYLAAVEANRIFNGSLENYQVRHDYHLIENLLQLPDERDAQTILWHVGDPEIKETGVSVPQSRGVDAKVRVVLPDSYSLRYNLLEANDLNAIFQPALGTSLWDHLVQSVRFRYLSQVHERLARDRKDANRGQRTDWLDSNVVVAIALVGENRYFDSFDRHSADAASHAMFTWRQFGDGDFVKRVLKRFGTEERVGSLSDPDQMAITSIIVRIYALPGEDTKVGAPNQSYRNSYEAIRERLVAVNRRTVKREGRLLAPDLVSNYALQDFLTFVRRRNLQYERDLEDEKKRAYARAEVARRLGLTKERRSDKIDVLQERIKAGVNRLMEYRQLLLNLSSFRSMLLDLGSDARSIYEPPPPMSDRQYAIFAQVRADLMAALQAFPRNHILFQSVTLGIMPLGTILDHLEEMMDKSQEDLERYQERLRQLQRVQDTEEKREEKKAHIERVRALRFRSMTPEALRAYLVRLGVDPGPYFPAEAKRAYDARRSGPGKFDEKAIILANISLGEAWFQRQFSNSVYVPILNRTDNLCLFWAVSLQMHWYEMRAKGKGFSFGAWTGAKAKAAKVEKKDEKDSDTEMETEIVVFGGRDPDTCKPWKKACYKLLRQLNGPMAGPSRPPKFPDDVVRLSELIGYPIAVFQSLPSGKVRVVLDTIAHAPQTVAVKKRIARQMRKSKEKDAAFAAAMQVDSGLLPELKSGYQMTEILPNSEHIMLFYSGKPAYHFDLIRGKEIGKFMERSQSDKDRLCRHCMDIYKVGSSHKCVYARCDRCHKNNCPSNFLTDAQYYGADKKECAECWQFFLTDTCYDNHKKKGKGKKYSVCEMFKYCKDCNAFYKAVVRIGGVFKEPKVVTQHNTEDGKSGHIHRGEICSQCNDIAETGHECMFARVKLKDPLYHHLGVLDTESIQPGGIHSTCLVVHSEGLATNPLHEYRKFKEMKDQKLVKSIDDYHPQLRKEKSRYIASVATDRRTAAEVFVDRMLDLREERKEWAKERKEAEDLTRVPSSQFTMLGFNSSGYDLPLLLQALCHNRDGLSVTTTYLGTRLLKLVLARGLTGINFIDAGRFITGSLARTVKTFGLEPELKAIGEPLSKGVAPFFNLEPDYVGPFPDKICFPVKDRRQAWFNEWYEEEQAKFVDKPYCYMDELIKYCTQDTRILGLAVAAFREQFLKATNRTLDPFFYTTLTSACMAYYSSRHMPEHGIANLPAKVNRAIRRGLYGGRVESRRMLFPVPECKTEPSDKTGYRQFSKSAYLVHLDFTSLYPSVLMDGLFPWGHPHWFLRKKDDMENAQWSVKDQQEWDSIYEPLRSLDCLEPSEDLSFDDIADALERFLQAGSCAMVLCDYSAPDDLWDPVLPAKKEGGGNSYDLLPKHFQLVNSVELLVALREGYSVDFIYAICYWPPERCSTSMFTSYYSKFVIQKDQCSGWPAGCDTEEKKQAYLKAYREHPKNHFGELDPTAIEDNPGGREINKFAINSHWGRYALSDNHPHHTIFDMDDAKSRLSFFDTLFNVDRNHCIGSPTVISSPDGTKAKIQLAYKRVNESKNEIEKGSPTNVAIGVFTTAHARMRLYEELKKLAPGRIFYMDTDSLTLVVDPEMKDVEVAPGQLRWDQLPETGSMLGQLKWEPKPGYKIRYYSSTGRKCYLEFGTYTDEAWEKYLKLKADGKEQPPCTCNKSSNCPAFLHAKVVTKGLPETPNADFTYNFTRVSIARKILGMEAPNPYECHFSLLRRVPAKQTVQTIPTVRKYRLFNEGCVLDPTGLTLPHGHKDVDCVLEGWEESAESVREMLADAEESLEKVAHKAVGYQFAYSSEPGWMNPEHPEHKEKMREWEMRQAVREKLHKEHEERIKMEEQLANQIEAAARAESDRQQALLDEAAEQLRALEEEIDRVEAEHEEAIRQYDERQESDLDTNDTVGAGCLDSASIVVSSLREGSTPYLTKQNLLSLFRTTTMPMEMPHRKEVN